MPPQTLVLDRSYQPINTVPWTRAISYVVRERADILEEYDREVHFNMGMPAVVRLRHSIGTYKKLIKFSRQNVLARDRFKCCFCGAGGRGVTLTFDHVVPRSRGGRTEWENIVSACAICNAKKADRTPEEAGMQLRNKPVRPTWMPSFNMALQSVYKVPEEWRAYWTVELVP